MNVQNEESDFSPPDRERCLSAHRAAYGKEGRPFKMDPV